MRILVTGGAGFVGLNIVEALANRRHDVVLTDVNSPPAAALSHLSGLSGAVSVRMLDVTSASSVAEMLHDVSPDVVIHAAALAPSAATELATASRTATVNVCGAMNVLQSALDAKVSRVVMISSAAVYGQAGETASILDEETTLPLPGAIYGITKLAAEKLAERFRSLTALDIVRVRVGSVYGPWEWQTAARDTLSPMLQIARLQAAGKPALLARPGRRDWIYSADVGNAVALLSEKRDLTYDLYNLATGVEFTIADWCGAVSAAGGKLDWRVAGAGERANVDLFAAFDRAPLAVNRLTEDLGFAPSRPVDEAVATYREWLATHPDY